MNALRIAGLFLVLSMAVWQPLCSQSLGDSLLQAMAVPEHRVIRQTPRNAELPLMASGIQKNRLYLVSGLTAATMVGSYVIHIEPWWSGEKQGFRVKFDWLHNGWLEIDKLGHFYSNIQFTRAGAASFEYAGLSRGRALWLGALNSTALFTAFELTDAGFADWGFSVPDYVANVMGAAYPILQHYQPVFRHFNFKLSYWPSEYYNVADGSRPGFINYDPYTYPSGDYDGMIYWLSADINWLLPDSVQPWWPDWLNIAVGYGARNLPQANAALKVREWYFALDYNPEALPVEQPLLKKIFSVANALHLPAPALRIDRYGSIFYLLKI